MYIYMYICMYIYNQTAREFHSLTIFAKSTPFQRSGRVPNTCYKIVVKKFPIYKLKQKRAKKIKN